VFIDTDLIKINGLESSRRNKGSL